MSDPECSTAHNEEVNHFLKLHEKDLELQAVKLAKFYSIDLHELLSRTRVTVWEKWRSDGLCTLPHDEGYKYTLRILANHARNLSKGTRREWNKCDLLPNEGLDHLTQATTWRDPAVEIIFNDARLAIYDAISLLEGRCRDVMVLIALGLENSEVRDELKMTTTNFTSTLTRARKLLRETLRLDDNHERGELR